MSTFLKEEPTAGDDVAGKQESVDTVIQKDSDVILLLTFCI